MLKKLKPILRFLSHLFIFWCIHIFSRSMSTCIYLWCATKQGVALSWEKPDTLSGFGVEVYSQCFTTCSSDGMTIEHIGQDSSGGWFRDNDGLAVDCDTDYTPAVMRQTNLGLVAVRCGCFLFRYNSASK